MDTNQKGSANTILILAVIMLLGMVGYFAFVKRPKPIVQQPTPTPAQTETPVSPTPTPKNETTNWKTYQNASLKIQFRYPGQLGEVTDGGKNAYLTHILSFSGESDNVNKTRIDTFTDKSVNDWVAATQRNLKNNEPIGDPAFLHFPLSVKTLLTSKSSGYDCTTDFGDNYLNKSDNETCQIVTVNGVKAFKIIATGPFQSEVSQIKYLFFVNGVWADFSKNFWVYDKNDPNKQLYAFEQMNSILQGKTMDSAIKAEADAFDKIISTVKFTK